MMAVTIRHRLWVAWDRLDLRWRVGGMLPLVRRGRNLEAQNDDLRDEIATLRRDITRITSIMGDVVEVMHGVAMRLDGAEARREGKPVLRLVACEDKTP